MKQSQISYMIMNDHRVRLEFISTIQIVLTYDRGDTIISWGKKSLLSFEYRYISVCLQKSTSNFSFQYLVAGLE